MLRLFKSILLFVVIVVVLLAAPLLFVSRDAAPVVVDPQDLPWNIELLSDGNTRVLGLIPGRSLLENAIARFGSGVQVALIVAPGGSGSVEAYYDSLALGYVSGKLILSLETTPAAREFMLQRAVKAEYMESATRRITLDNADQKSLATAKISALTFIPSAQLDEAIVLERFGAPAERVRSGEYTEHFLYPGKGLDLRLDAKGKEVLQFVSPREFARVRDPLFGAAAAR